MQRQGQVYQGRVRIGTVLTRSAAASNSGWGLDAPVLRQDAPATTSRLGLEGECRTASITDFCPVNYAP